jgi:hypothetical protein
MLPLAHVGHYLWVFYLLPVVFVVLAIIKTTLSEKRATSQPDEPSPSRREGDEPSPSQASGENPGPEDAPPAGGTRRGAENEYLARRRPSS